MGSTDGIVGFSNCAVDTDWRFLFLGLCVPHKDQSKGRKMDLAKPRSGASGSCRRRCSIERCSETEPSNVEEDIAENIGRDINCFPELHLTFSSHCLIKPFSIVVASPHLRSGIDYLTPLTTTIIMDLIVSSSSVLHYLFELL